MNVESAAAECKAGAAERGMGCTAGWGWGRLKAGTPGEQRRQEGRSPCSVCHYPRLQARRVLGRDFILRPSSGAHLDKFRTVNRLDKNHCVAFTIAEYV